MSRRDFENEIVIDSPTIKHICFLFFPCNTNIRYLKIDKDEFDCCRLLEITYSM